MSFEPNPKQALFLWKLLAAETDEEREPQMSKARPDLHPSKERAPLVDHGFITLESRAGKRGSYVVLTDRAWAWAADTLDVELMKSNSRVGAEALQGLLRRLLPFLKQHDLSLASLFSPRSPASASQAVTSAGNGEATRSPGGHLVPMGELPALIEQACLALAGGARKTRVRLSDLRKRFGSVPREALDETLLDLQDQGRLVLYRDDNTAALTEDDHRAALHVGNAPRHLVYLEA